MRAVFTQPPGGLDSTQLTDVPDPVAGPDDVLVELQAVGLNPADRFQIEGMYPGGPQPPFIPGRDAAGVVVQADRAGRYPVGTKVLVLQSSATNLTQGTLCERQRFAAETVAPIPNGWSVEAAAAAPLAYLTAWQALTVHGDQLQDRVVAVTGASGGVGLAAVQLARGLGATVVAFSRSAEKRKKLQEFGATHVLAADSADLKRDVKAALGRSGVDLVVETVGGPWLGTAVHLLAPNGYVAVVGVLAGVDGFIPIPSLMFKQCSLHGILVSSASPEAAQEDWARVVEILARSNQRPHIDRCFALADYEAAFHRLAQSPFGKVVVEMNPDTGL
jgi:NADPH2:quinone reductase